MITEFQLMSKEGKVLALGEIDNDIYRLFSADFPTGYQEFQTLEEMFATSGGVAIQPSLFETSARTRQPKLFQKEDRTGDCPV